MAFARQHGLTLKGHPLVWFARNPDWLPRNPDELRKLYAALDPDKETIVYCQSGNRAAETAAVLADLGFKNVKVYDSSWLGYASVLTAPAEDETWLNVGALHSTVQSLEARVEELERKLAQRRP